MCDLLIKMCLMFLIVFTPLAYGSVQPWAIAVFEVVAGVMMLCWILKIFSTGNYEVIGNPLLLLVLVVIVYAFIQWITSAYMLKAYNYSMDSIFSIYPWATKTELLKIISYALIFIVTLNTVRTIDHVYKILAVIIATGFIVSVLYLLRFFGAEVPRTLINWDHLSAYLGMIISLGLGLLFILKNTAQKYLLFFIVVVMGAGLLFSLSRGGMLSFMGALIAMSALTAVKKSVRNKGWILVTALVGIVLMISWMGATPVVEKIGTIKAEIMSHYFGGRYPVWEGTAGIIKDYPVFGTGIGTFNYIFPKYQPLKIITGHYTYAHSDFLELFSEIGIAGFLLFSVFFVISLSWIFKRFINRSDSNVTGLSIGFFGALTSIVIHSFTEFNLKIPANAILLVIILAMFISVLNYKYKRHSRHKIQGRLLHPAAILLTVMFIITCIRPAVAEFYFQKFISSEKNNDKAGELNYELLTRAIKLDFSNAKYHYFMGKLYFKRCIAGDINIAQRSILESVYELKKAIELNPTNNKYHRSLAWVYGQIDNLPSSVSSMLHADYTRLAHNEFQKSIALSPNKIAHRRIYANWLLMHPVGDNVEIGESQYKKIVELRPDQTNSILEQYFKVEKTYAKLKRIFTDTSENHGMIMNKLLDAGLWDNNVSDFKKDMKAAEYKYPYYKVVSRYYAKNNNTKKSIEILEKYLQIDSNCADAHFWIADRSFYNKNYTWHYSRRHHKKAIELDSDNPYYRYWYAIHLTYKGRKEEAECLFDDTVKMDPGYVVRINEFKEKYFNNEI